MPEFSFAFEVNAPLEAVRDFHSDTRALKRLTPPPMWAQLRRVEPLAESSLAEFTLWLGPIPIRWRALHRDVGEFGFTDVQVQGPMALWEHTHRFEPLGTHRTRVCDHIVYRHQRGWRGMFSSLLFNKLSLYLLFTWRHLVTQRALHLRGTR